LSVNVGTNSIFFQQKWEAKWDSFLQTEFYVRMAWTFYFFLKKTMKEKIYEPARHNEESPAEGMAAVNTFTPEETSIKVPEKAIKESEERGAEEEEG